MISLFFGNCVKFLAVDIAVNVLYAFGKLLDFPEYLLHGSNSLASHKRNNLAVLPRISSLHSNPAVVFLYR